MSSHASQGPAALAVLAVIAVVMLWVSMRMRKRERLVSDLPNSKVQGVFIGLVELKVSAESENPLTSFLSGQPCVQYTYKVEEEWRRTVTENNTDEKGQSQTRSRVEEGWETVASGGDSQPFYGRDETGVILIRPQGATFEYTQYFSDTCTAVSPLYHSKGPVTHVRDSTGRRRFTESWIPLHAPLFIVGQARERQDVVAPEIAQSKDAPLFLISSRPQNVVEAGYAAYSWLALAAGLVFALAAGAFGHDRVHAAPTHAGAVACACAYLALWALSWAWMVFNSLVGLRARVRQAWSLIDIELKRRRDLIPNLAAAVSALSSHEAGVQEAVSALRAQQSATPPGQAGPDISGLAPTLRAVAERYPNLVAQEGFSRLQKQLVETEQRIALARGYYNDIATHFATRVGQIPDAWLASLGGIRPEPLLEASGFERAAVQVKLSGA